MKKRLLKIYEKILKTNEELIEEGKFSGTTCFVIAKNYDISMMVLVFSSPFEKLMMRKKIKEFVAKLEAKAYILVSAVKMNLMRLDTNKMESFDACLNALYTPQEKITRVFVYKDNKITDRQEFNRKDSKDEWDIWNEFDRSLTDEQFKNYNKFKEDNKTEFKDVI